MKNNDDNDDDRIPYPPDSARLRGKKRRKLTRVDTREQERRDLERIEWAGPSRWTDDDLSLLLQIKLEARRRGDHRRAARAERLSDRMASVLHQQMEREWQENHGRQEKPGGRGTGR